MLRISRCPSLNLTALLVMVTVGMSLVGGCGPRPDVGGPGVVHRPAPAPLPGRR